jgi:hypothetical protein
VGVLVSAVQVNECAIFATRRGVDWWLLFRSHGPESRFVVVTASLAGDRVNVQCEDREHAEWLLGRLLEEGVPKSALKVIR